MRLSAVLITIVSLISFRAANAQEVKSEDIYKSALPSVMTLRVTKSDSSQSLGTGFLALKDGFVVTAWHVVKDAKFVKAVFSNGEEFECSGLIDKDEKRDVALIRIKQFGRPKLELSEGDPSIGSKAYVLGAPQGLEFSFSDGIVSQEQVFAGVKYLQYTSPTSQGNSGGPVLDAKGKVMGVVSWGLIKGQNLNFAVPAVYVKGLDQTLSTTAWEAVKPSPTSPTAADIASVVSNEKFDEETVSLTCRIQDIYLALSITYDKIRSDGGYRTGAPSELYLYQKKLANQIERTAAIDSGDSKRSNYLRLLRTLARTLDETASQMIKAIKDAQRTGGWNNEASEMVKKAQAELIALSKKELIEAEEAYFKLAEVQSRAPKGLRIRGLIPREPSFSLGFNQFVEDPQTLLTRVIANSHASRFGFQSGDRLVSLEGKICESIDSFKSDLNLYLGKRVKVVIVRNRKEKTLTINVPKTLE